MSEGRRPTVARLLAFVFATLLLAGCGGDEIGPTAEATGTFPYRGPDRTFSPAEPTEVLGGLAGGIACEDPGEVLEADAVVGVTITDGAMEVDTDEVIAGTVRFEVMNAGEEPHELVIVYETAPEELPLEDEGGVDASAIEDQAVRGTLSLFPAGTTCTGTFELAPGSYTLLCNVVEPAEGVNESHFESGEYAQIVATSPFDDEE